MSIEVEAKFKIVPGKAQAVLAELTQIERMGGYMFGAPATHTIQDTYFDNHELALFKRDAGLRVRKQDDDLLVTLKIKQNTQPGATITRLEIEGPPIVEILAHIWDTLDTEGVVRQTFRVHRNPPDDVSSMFDGWGFKALFTINNSRIERDIYNAAGEHVAMLMLDEATVSNEDQQDTLTEIEVEAVEAQATQLPGIIEALETQFPDLLTPSDQSKYQQGVKLVGLG